MSGAARLGLTLLVAGCGASAPASGPDAEEARIRALAAEALDCEAEHLHARVIGEGDSTTGETVDVWWVRGCDRIGEFYCDRDGCQQHHAVYPCDAPPDSNLIRPDCELLYVRRRYGGTDYVFEDLCFEDEHRH